MVIANDNKTNSTEDMRGTVLLSACTQYKIALYHLWKKMKKNGADYCHLLPCESEYGLAGMLEPTAEA